MVVDIPPDPRIKAYEAVARIVDGKGGVTAISPGTRIYREVGPEMHFHLWLKDVQDVFKGELIPFEWVCDYVGITRAALHKRVNRGGLTVLAFEMRQQVPGILGGMRERMRNEYKFVPRTECDRWREILIDQINNPK